MNALTGSGSNGGASAFTPKSIAGLVTWYDFNDGSSITLNAGKVASISDKSDSNVTASQGTGSRQPVWNSSGGFNNHAYAQFTNTNVTFLLAAGPVTCLGNFGTTMSYAARFKAAAQARGCLIGRSAGVNPDTWLSSGDTGQTSKLMHWLNDTVGGAGNAAISNGTPYDNSWHTVVSVWNGGVFNQYIDGVLDSASPQTLSPPSTMPTPYTQTFMLGGVNSSSPVLLLSGSMEFACVYNTALTLQDAINFANFGA